MKKYFQLVILALLCILQLSCKKGFLDKKANIALVVPETLDEMQTLLDNDRIMNGAFQNVESPVPSLGEYGSDNYYFPDANLPYIGIYRIEQTYTWQKQVFNGTVLDWNYPYACIFYANNVLKGLENIPITSVNETQWKNIKGSALFYRSHALYQLSQIFAKQYNEVTASSDLGLPLRLSPDINIKSERATLKETYSQILADLEESTILLPATVSFKTRPSKPAAFGLLSRVYLIMGEYEKARINADSCLSRYNVLMDFNNSGSPDFVNAGGFVPFRRFNIEVIFQATMQGDANFFGSTFTRVSPELYNSYNVDDLRKTAFFRSISPGHRFKGNYDNQNVWLFAGIATDEIYLIRAECNARLGQTSSAIDDLNTLMVKRWRNNGTWSPFTAVDANDALTKILVERRKELIFRGLRWTDLRRLNKEGANITLTRVVNGQTFTLPPNDDRWVFPIPPDVISANPQMPQNPR